VNEPGAFVISLDTELAWGAVHHQGTARNDADYARTRDVIRDLLQLFQRYEIRATWAVVGHLMLERCSPHEGVKHPASVRPAYPWFRGDWFDQDPCTDVASDPFWYGPDIVESIRACPVPQEIGSHGFSHMIIGDPGCPREAFLAELQQSREAAGAWGIPLQSFVYPRNAIGYTDDLAENGFLAYRGVAPAWHEKLPSPVRRAARLVDAFLPVTPASATPTVEGKVCNIPATYFYLHRKSWARLVPIAVRTSKALKGLRHAAHTGQVFHMWFHPFNIASDPGPLLRGLEDILQGVAILRSSGLMVNETMGSLAKRLLEAQAAKETKERKDQ
jgi:peptidoglycan/xylan/chitin deacetylase (PgdA/CDA1 family)